MTKKMLLVILVAAVALAGWLAFLLHTRGKTTSTTTTTTTVATIPVETYFYRGAALVPVVVRVPKTEAVASAATRALLTGAPAGYRTALPAGVKLDDLTIVSGTARASFSSQLADAPRTAQAQIVYTLTQFPTVTSVVIDAGGSTLRLSNGAADTISGAAARADYGDLTSDAQIFVEAPLRDTTVTSPVTISGTASVFEATFSLDVVKEGKRLETDTITASSGAPDRGTFAKTLDLAPGKYTLVFYESSAANGSHLHSTTVDITVAG